LTGVKFTDPELAHFSLRGLKIEQLRDLASQYLSLDTETVAQLQKTELISQLSTAAPDNRGLSSALRKQSISFKPSFYLMRFSDGKPVSLETAKRRMNRHLQKSKDGLHVLQVQLAQEYKPNGVEVLLTWESDLTYWSPSIQLETVRRLQFGFGIIDYASQKAIISCHTEREREDIAQLLSEGFSLQLGSLVLTKPLLELIGTFDKVKRASYVLDKPDLHTPANIVYSDDNLGAKRLASEEENDSRSQRAQSFYRIPILDSIIEEGLGATSGSGKLWLPKETPIDVVRDYGTALLAKISGTLNTMAKNNEIEAVLSTYKFEEMPELSSADPVRLRLALVELVRVILVMLANSEEERPYSLPPELALYGVPRFFSPPLLRLIDTETNELALWTDPQFGTKTVRVKEDFGRYRVYSEVGKQEIDLDQIEHPITNQRIRIGKVLESLFLIPGEEFNRVIQDAILRVSESLPKLNEVKEVFFTIRGNVLKVDLRRAYGELRAPTLIAASEINECEQIFERQTVHPAQRKKVNDRLVELGEKCTSMSDENCTTCIHDKKFLCLRSLVGTYFRGVEILAHKGIELYDLSVQGNIAGKPRTMWGFAKLPSGPSDRGLTARNSPGAILLAQITGQLDKSTFKAVLVVTPSTVNQDFKDRLEILCKAFEKEVCFLGIDELGRMLLEFEERAKFDGLDLEKLYAESKKRIRAKKRDEMQPRRIRTRTAGG
jgi:hypothetical protein